MDYKDAFLFPYLYPYGTIPNNQTNRPMVLGNRLFHIDPRFRDIKEQQTCP